MKRFELMRGVTRRTREPRMYSYSDFAHRRGFVRLQEKEGIAYAENASRAALVREGRAVIDSRKFRTLQKKAERHLTVSAWRRILKTLEQGSSEEATNAIAFLESL